tara:strand:+ start:892 stop:1065 length:174 start_codon:yes stop_codon:yes gene_type:complete
MREDLLNDLIIREKLEKERRERKYQPLQLEIPLYEETPKEVEKEVINEPRRVIIIEL